MDATGREVRLDGQPSPIEPRPFDLLVHLIRHRHRVVTKRELFAQLWTHETVTEGALARAVMKARQAIADNGEPPLIRTVPRVGYRFVAPLAGDASTASAVPASTAATPDVPHAIAVLPFANATGDSGLDWLPVGLMSLTVQALGDHRCFAPVATQSLLAAVEGRKHDNPKAVIAAVQTVTGARWVVQGRVTRGLKDYRLDLEVTDGGRPLQGEVRAAQPAQLAAQAAALLQRLITLDTTAPATKAPALRDPMATEAFARGLQAMAVQKWPQAVNLLRLALDLDPAPPEVRLELLRALAALGAPGGVALARELLLQAERDNDLRYAAHVHQALGRLHLNAGDLRAATYCLEKALRVAAGQETPDWTAQTLLLQASVAVHELAFDAAERSLDRVRQLCEVSGNRIFPLAALNMRAVMASVHGDLERSVRLSMEVVRQARELRAQRYLVDACANVTWDLVELARLDEAPAFGEEGFAAAIEASDWQQAAGVAVSLSWLYRLADAPEALTRIVHTLPEPAQLPRPADGWIVLGHHAAVLGHHAQAARCFQQAAALQRKAQDRLQEHITLPWLFDALIRSDQLDAADAELQRASQPPHDQDAQLAAQVLQARARRARIRGDATAALALLQQALAGEPTPLWRGLAGIDAASLFIEAGDRAQARALLHALPPALASLAATIDGVERAAPRRHEAGAVHRIEQS